MQAVDMDLAGVYLACLLHVCKTRHQQSQRDVAVILNMSPQLLSDLKYGRKPLTPTLMTSIAGTFGFRWQDIAAALPPWWRDRDEVIRRNEGNPALNGHDRPIDRYLNALLLEVPRLDVRIFPEVKEQRVPTRTEAGMTLPIRDYPTSGNPILPPGFSGYTSVIPEPAMQLSQYADQPYLLRMLETDQRGRFYPGDLLLVDQRPPDEKRPEEMRLVVVVRYREKYLLARREGETYLPVSPMAGIIRPEPGESVEVVGVVKAIVWSSEIR